MMLVCVIAFASNLVLQFHLYSYMNDQSLRLAKQLRLKTTPFFSREKEELPQAGLEPATFCIHVQVQEILLYFWSISSLLAE